MIDFGADLQRAYDDGYMARDAEIVRCKDCRFLGVYGIEFEIGTEGSSKVYQACKLHKFELTDKEGFCSWGRLRSEDNMTVVFQEDVKDQPETVTVSSSHQEKQGEGVK